MSLLEPPKALIGPLVTLIIQHLRDSGKNDGSIDAILAREKQALTNKYKNDVQMQFHTADLNTAYDTYKQKAQPIIQQMNKLSITAQNANVKVRMARNAGEPNSNEERAASSNASNAKIQVDELSGQLRRIQEEYQAEVEQANATAARELIDFLNLQNLTKSGGRRRTRNRHRSRKTRGRPRRKN